MIQDSLSDSLGLNHAELGPKLTAISKSVSRIAHIVKSLEKYSQTDSKKKPKPIKLRSVFDEAITLVGPKLNRFHVELKSNFESDGTVIGNEIELEQVFINLLNNALDAIKSLIIKWIKVELVETDSALRLSITDSGDGIPALAHERIFEPFQTSKLNGEGTGLGLAIVRGILLDHGANIELDTQCSNTRFVVTFPKSGG